MTRFGRRRLGWTALLVGLVCSALVSGCTDAEAPVTVRLGPEQVSTSGRGLDAPEQGAWVGAWVDPTTPTQEGRVEGIAQFEARLGRPLDLVNSFHDWSDEFPTPADVEVVNQGRRLMVSWAGTDTRVIASGRYDDFIRDRARAVRDLGVPMLIRWRWEMDRPNLRASVWSPEDYVAAWERLRRIFAEEGASNAGWVWCPLASGFPEGRAQPYYPGDDQVDWLCADVYPGPEKISFAEGTAAFLDWAVDHPRPVMIGEFGAEAGEPDFQAEWLREAGDVLATNWQVRAAVYFEGSIEADNAKGKAPYDYTLLEGSPGLDAFRGLADQLAARAPRPSVAPS